MHARSQGPQLVILVPTLELGVQITLLVYKLFGGNPSSGRVPGDGANMFRYSGPRGAKARGPDPSPCNTGDEAALRPRVLLQ